MFSQQMAVFAEIEITVSLGTLNSCFICFAIEHLIAVSLIRVKDYCENLQMESAELV